MKLTSTQLTLIYLLFLCFGCSPKPTFYLNKGTGSFNEYQKVLREQTPQKNTLFPAAEAGRLANSSSANINAPVALYSSASSQAEIQIPASPSRGTLVQANFESFKTSPFPHRQDGKLVERISRKRDIFNRKLLEIADNGKPNHKVAKLGFLLSLGGVLLILLSVLLGNAAPLLLAAILFIAGFITSLRGLSKIKKAPDQYGGKGFAIIGIILSGLILLASIAFILYVLSFAGAFV